MPNLRRTLLAPIVLILMAGTLSGCWLPGGPGPEVCELEDLRLTRIVHLGVDGEATIDSCLQSTSDEDVYRVVPPFVPGTLGIGCGTPIDHGALVSFVTTGAGGGANGSHTCTTADDQSQVPFDATSTATITISDSSQADVPYTLLLTFVPDGS